MNTSLFINTDTHNNNDGNDSIAGNNVDMPLSITNETDLQINETNNNMNEPAVNINSDETTYINDSEHSKSENNITIDSANDLNTNIKNNFLK